MGAHLARLSKDPMDNCIGDHHMTTFSALWYAAKASRPDTMKFALGTHLTRFSKDPLANCIALRHMTTALVFWSALKKTGCVARPDTVESALGT